MMEWLRHLLRLDAEEAIDLGEGETILHVTGRHFIVLLVREIIPVLGVLFFGGLATYRAVGGTFLVIGTGQPVGLDIFNILLLALLGALALVWVALWVRRSKKDRRPRYALIASGALVLLLFYFRYNGGRIFLIDPISYPGQGLDAFNIVLLLLTAVSAFFTLFVFYDWLNDELIVTTQRVVYDNDQVFIPRLIEQRVQEQIFLEDVQDVSASTKTYLQHWFDYGTVIVKSARIGGNIEFAAAAGPRKMQKAIMDQVNALRKQASSRNYDSMIEARVYNNRPPKPRARLTIKQTQGMRAIRWLVLENPEFNEDNETLTWRPHWLFQAQALLRPFSFLIIGLLILAVTAQLVYIQPFWLTLLGIVLLVAFTAWCAYEIEDYRNDRYILTPTNVIDIEKKPFGPEDRRQASLGALTNVSFQTTFVSNLLGYGDVILETAGSGGKFTFTHVPRPGDVVTTINEYFVRFKRGEKEKALNDTLDLLRHYHEAQMRHNELAKPTPVENPS